MQRNTTTDKIRFVRPKQGLPLTLMVTGKTESIGGGAMFEVIQFGHSKTEYVRCDEVNDYVPHRPMAELLNQWLTMINRPERVNLL